MYVITIAAYVLLSTAHVHGHGKMMEPPQRSSLWRVIENGGFEANYNDNELFCGGFSRQWTENGGKCGICGDPYDGPRENEAGGKFAKGYIAKSYNEGQQFIVTIDLSAAHKGYFEFRLCPHNDTNTTVKQECLDKHLLPRADNLETRYYPGDTKGIHTIPLQLPVGVTCSQCVLQWHYNAGNTWNCDDDGNCCTGCGPQETFRNCADISIV